jgi:CheY-like chemotaxis protein
VNRKPQTAGVVSRKHILVVEDNADVLRIFGELLTILGHTFNGVQSAEEALDILSGKDTFDILFTDITLPGMSGIELAKKIALTKLPITIIFTSGHGDIPRDAIDFPSFSLPKPYTLVQLKEVLANVSMEGNHSTMQL